MPFSAIEGSHYEGTKAVIRIQGSWVFGRLYLILSQGGDTFRCQSKLIHVNDYKVTSW